MRRGWVVILSLCLLFTMVMPAFAADPAVDIKDLKGINPRRNGYLFSVAGGAAIGAAVGVILGGGNDITKGLLVGGGGASTAYLHTHRNFGGGWRPWEMLAGHTALGAGVGWTVCGCDDGLAAGTLIGAGASALWQASQPRRSGTTAQSRP